MFTRALSIAVVLGTAGVASAGSYYLALGDSIAYGLQPVPNGLPFPFNYNVPSNGDRYYVADVAAAVGNLEGSRPTVLNFSLPGETSTSFGNTFNPFGAANVNYGLTAFGQARTTSQLQAATQAIGLFGSQITTVSFALGANDFLQLDGTLQTNPAAAAAAFASITSRYASFLTTVRTLLPSARIILPGYYNPYGASDPRHDLANGVIAQLNGIIQTSATASGGRYVDFYTPIEGRQASLLSTGDIHPNDAGYAALGRAATQAVPEPSAMAALVLGMAAVVRRRARARRAAVTLP